MRSSGEKGRSVWCGSPCSPNDPAAPEFLLWGPEFCFLSILQSSKMVWKHPQTWKPSSEKSSRGGAWSVSVCSMIRCLIASVRIAQELRYVPFIGEPMALILGKYPKQKKWSNHIEKNPHCGMERLLFFQEKIFLWFREEILLHIFLFRQNINHSFRG